MSKRTRLSAVSALLLLILPILSARADNLRFIDAPLSAVLASFSSITGHVYSDELQTQQKVTLIVGEDVTADNADAILNSIIEPLGGQLEKTGERSYRIISKSVTKLETSATNSSVTIPVTEAKNVSPLPKEPNPQSTVKRLNLDGKLDRRGLEQLISVTPALKSVEVINDGLSQDTVILVGEAKKLAAVKQIVASLSAAKPKAETTPQVSQIEEIVTISPNTSDSNSLTELTYRVIDLRFLMAETLVASLDKMLAGGSLGADGSLSAHGESNQVMLVGASTWVETMNAMILEMDREPRQVFVDAIIAEVSEESTRRLGIQFSGRTGVIGAAQGSTTSGLDQGTLSGNSVLTGLTGGMLAIGGGASGLPDLGLLLSAIEGDSENRVLATPSLMTLENRESEILVGQNVPLITGKYAAQSGESTASPFQTIQRQDLGISLKIRPRIGSNNDIILEIRQEVSSIDPQAAGLSDVATKKREISTMIRARPGETIAIGGLRDTQSENVETKVPLLGDLPVLGVLFRQEMTRIRNTNLVIFLRPTLMTTQDARVKLLERQESKMQTKTTSPNINEGDGMSFKFLEPDGTVKTYKLAPDNK